MSENIEENNNLEEKKSTSNQENTTEIKTEAEITPEITEQEVVKEISNNEEISEISEVVETVEEATEVEKIEEVEIIKIDFTTLSKEELVSQLETLVKNNPIHTIKDGVEEIKQEFYTKFNIDLEKNKEVFLTEGGNIIDFYYTTPLKKEFSSLYFDYKEKRNNYYKDRTKDLNQNLTKRLELLEELKNLFDEKGSTGTIYKHFRNIQERWFEAGSIPRDKNNIVWNNYYHHVDNFYNILHLDRAFRDRSFKNNLEQKLGLIGNAEELAQEKDILKAFRELQMLHKIWKEEIGPVAKEFSDDIWEKFSAATKIIHDKRQELEKELEKEFEANYESKKQIVAQIQELTDKSKNNHKDWQNTIAEVQKQRDLFFDGGRVSKTKNNEIWNLFKEVTRNFNKSKNAFYKDQKKEQFTNLEKKQELIKIAEENKEGDDFEVLTSLFKKIQDDWKKIGHVPRKDSDKIWKQFKGACNFYFDRLHAQKNEANKEEVEHLKIKEELLEKTNNIKLSGNKEEDLKSINDSIATWKTIGRVPYNKRNIDRDFNKTLDTLFNQLDIDKKEIDLIKFENKINTLASQEDDRKLKNEEFFLGKKVEETKNEIRQLENNLLFFKHVKDDNPLVIEVNKNIKKHQDQLEIWVSKLRKIRALRKG